MSDLINKETGIEIADTPEKLPPLRDGYVRVIHQTRSDYAKSLADKGLIYNREYSRETGGGRWLDVTYMTDVYFEDEFWERLTSNDIRHRGADVIAVFDMPAEEYRAHSMYQMAAELNGTISRGYLVGVIPNYGVKDSETEQKLSISEMKKMKAISKSNPLPPFYETPNWRENIKNAWKNMEEKNKVSLYPWERNTENNEENNNVGGESAVAKIQTEVTKQIILANRLKRGSRS